MKPLCIAHRGKHDKYFENTLNAFKEAAKGDFFGIETDIHLTKDNYWVVHHDPDFLSNGQKYVIAELTKDEVIKLPLDNDQGDKEAYIPLFEDYLKICEESGKRPIIEFKPKNPKLKYIKQVVKMVNEHMGHEKIPSLLVLAFKLVSHLLGSLNPLLVLSLAVLLCESLLMLCEQGLCLLDVLCGIHRDSVLLAPFCFAFLSAESHDVLE